MALCLLVPGLLLSTQQLLLGLYIACSCIFKDIWCSGKEQLLLESPTEVLLYRDLV